MIRSIYQLLANDEARHARAYYSYMQRALERDSHQARSSFSKIGVLMTNPRMNRARHPTHLHVNKSLFPNDTVNGPLPDPSWLTQWLDEEIRFAGDWEDRVERGLLQNLSSPFGEPLDNSRALRQFHKSLAA